VLFRSRGGRYSAAVFDSPVTEPTARALPLDRYSHAAAPEEIAENDYNLNIPRYVDTYEPEEEIDIAEVQREIDQIEAELAEIRVRMRGHLKELGVDV